MHGCLEICTEHSKVWNAKGEYWQAVSGEMLEELKEMAREVGNVSIFEGCCDTCNSAVQASFLTLHQARLASAAYAEVGNEVIMPWEDVE